MFLHRVTDDDAFGDLVIQISTYGICWMLGFAHHDGTIKKVALPYRLAAGVGLMAGGLYAVTHQQPDGGWDINNIPFANFLYCTGAVLILLSFYPSLRRMKKNHFLDSLVSAFNSRAMTIYIWGNAAINLGWAVCQNWDDGNWDIPAEIVLSWTILFGIVILFGWVEDIAAGKPVALHSWPRRKAQPWVEPDSVRVPSP